MLTPKKIQDLIKQVSTKHTSPQHGLYPPQRKIISYISRQADRIQKNNKYSEVIKVQEMTNLLEGFIRYLNNTNKILKLDVERILTYIYYPENEEITLTNKDNLLIGPKGATVRIWHDAYFMNNRGPIFNRLIDCKNVLYDKIASNEYLTNQGSGMPEQMQQKYEEMLSPKEQAA